MRRGRRVSGGDSGGNLKVTKAMFKVLVKEQPTLKVYEERFNWVSTEGDYIFIPTRAFDLGALKTMYKRYQDEGSRTSDRWAMGQVGALIEVHESPNKKPVKQLRALELALISYVKKNLIHCWAFFYREQTTALQPILVTEIQYVPPQTRQDGSIEPAFVYLEGRFWSRGKAREHRVEWLAHDLAEDGTVEQLLSRKSVVHETRALIETYEKQEKTFIAWRRMMGEQFVGDGVFYGRDSHWSAREHDYEMRGTRLVVDDRCDEIETRSSTNIFYGAGYEDSDEGGSEAATLADKYSRIPVEPYIWCFNLSSYRGGFVLIDHMKPYVYRPELREKLILPPEHADLIDALTADMDVLMEDIISGKSGGTTIICQGKAGTGKTLTAEVYSETVKRPLYRVHSGQLGTDAEGVEEALKEALDNAKRWRAVLLIDEADVFVSERGDDMEKNAVVGVFLRTLEYYDGLLFLTTNRLDTIDEAILSRCIAQIKYELPDEDERFRLWKTLGGVFGMELVQNDKMARALAQAFACTGRDIKGLIKLVTKYSRQRGKKPDLAAFKRMAAFKGL